MTSTTPVALIKERLTFEGGTRRYPTDVYFGSGAWPVLTDRLDGTTQTLEIASPPNAVAHGSRITSMRTACSPNSLMARTATTSTTTNGCSDGGRQRRI